jgi:hypothetical protein
MGIVRADNFSDGAGTGAPDFATGAKFSGGIEGKADGVDVVVGAIGEKITSGAMSTTAVASSTYVDVTGASITLTAGVWMIYANFLLRVDQSGGGTINCKITDSANTFVGGASTIQLEDGDKSAKSIFAYANISSSTTYKLRIASSGASSLEVADQSVADDADDAFFAVRVG